MCVPSRVCALYFDWPIHAVYQHAVLCTMLRYARTSTGAYPNKCTMRAEPSDKNYRTAIL
jgi:hypothetical protein